MRAGESLVYDRDVLTEAYVQGRVDVLHQGITARISARCSPATSSSTSTPPCCPPRRGDASSAPVMLVHGRNDLPIPFERSALEIARRLPHADLVALAHCGHSPPWSIPASWPPSRAFFIRRRRRRCVHSHPTTTRNHYEHRTAVHEPRRRLPGPGSLLARDSRARRRKHVLHRRPALRGAGWQRCGQRQLRTQFRQVFKNLADVLHGLGLSHKHLVKFTTFLVHSQDIETFMKLRAEYFPTIFREVFRPIPC